MTLLASSQPRHRQDVSATSAVLTEAGSAQFAAPISTPTREHVPFGYWRRRKLAVGLVVLVHLPFLAWASAKAPGLAAVLALAMLAWTRFVTRSHVLRGWTVRLPAESVADLLRVALPIVLGSITAALWLNAAWIVPFAVESFVLFVLIVQTLFWRGRPKSWVRILGSPSNLGAAVSTFDQCMDLLGHDGCRFATFRADRPDYEGWERRIRAWIQRGETVVVLEPQLRPLAMRMRVLGDVIVAEDCLLFTPIKRQTPRVIDVTLGVLNQLVALMGTLVLLPIGLVVAILIKLDDGGPIFFMQERIGMNGETFRMYKFRSMRMDAPKYEVHPSEEDDPRVTSIGKIIRKCSLDELPQLINVFRGEMRLVGPRPEMPFIVDKYDDVQAARLAVRPGITGLWQVSPHRNDPIHEHIEYDLAYIAHRGPILDLALIIATIGLASRSGF